MQDVAKDATPSPARDFRLHGAGVRKVIRRVRKVVRRVRKVVLRVRKVVLRVRKVILRVRKDILRVRKDILRVRKVIPPLTLACNLVLDANRSVFTTIPITSEQVWLE